MGIIATVVTITIGITATTVITVPRITKIADPHTLICKYFVQNRYCMTSMP
jgi:hypothetical protein